VLQASGGGVTISGGEALMQPAFVGRVLRGAKELGLHTALDTSGYLGRHASDALLDDVDLVLLDVKSGDPDTYRRVTGRELAPTLEFGRRLADRGTEIWIRFVLVPGLTDDMEDLAKTAEFAAGLGNVERVEVLPFHQMGRFKWEKLGLDYTLADTQPPRVGATERACQIFRDAGLTAH